MSVAATSALREATRALSILSADMRISGLSQRLRTPIARVRDQLDTISWLLDYEASPVDILQNDCHKL